MDSRPWGWWQWSVVLLLLAGLLLAAVVVVAVYAGRWIRREPSEVQTLGCSTVHAVSTGSANVDAVAAVEPYVSIGEEQGIARSIASYETVDLTPFLLCARPEFVDGNRAATVAFLRGWIAAARVVQAEPERAAAIMLAAYREQGYELNKTTMARALGRLGVRTDFAPELPPYLTREAQEMLREKKIGALPDWGKALRGEFLAEARKG